MSAVLPFLEELFTDALLPGALTLAIGIPITGLLFKLISGALKKSPLDPAAHGLIKALLKIILYVLLGLILAEKLGFDTTGIVALASVLTLAISLSLQNALANVMGGITLLSTKPFKIGDFVELAEQSGTVRSIGLTYTRLHTPDNKVISLPNSSVVSAQIINHTGAGSRRIDIAVFAPSDAPLSIVLEGLQEFVTVEKSIIVIILEELKQKIR